MKKEEFLNKNKTAQALYSVITNCSEKPLYEWTDNDLDRYMTQNEFISANTIQTYLYLIRQLHKFECDERNIKCNELNLKRDVIDYVNIPKLRSKTILTPEEFWGIRNELVYYGNDGLEHNFRDVTLFHLSFLGLTSKEIQFLKEDDIEDVNNNKEKLILHLCTGRDVIVDNKQMIEDILLTIKEDYYVKAKEYKTREQKREDIIDYVWSPYLIKNIANGNSESGEPIKHPGRMLQRNLEKLSHPAIDMAHLSVEDIRRSLVLMLIDEGTQFTQMSLGKKQQGDLIWLKKIKRRLLEYEAQRKIEGK